MTNINIPFLQTKKFFQSYPVILLFQHNNLTVKEWSDLRVGLEKYDHATIFLLKNTIAEQVLFKSKISKIEFNYQNIAHSNIKIDVFQGPCFAVGFSNPQQIKNILKATSLLPHIILLGGILNNQLFTHLDITKLTELDNRIYNSLLFNFSQNHILYNTLQNLLSINILEHKLIELINCLETLKAKK